MHRYTIRRANLALYPVDRPHGVALLHVEDGRLVSVMRLLDTCTGHFQRVSCRVYLNQDGECFIFLERPTSLQHELFGDLQVPAGWWLAREEPQDRNDIATPSTPMRGSTDDLA